MADLGSPDIVMLGVAPAAAARILGDAMPTRVRRALVRFRHGPGVFKVDFAVEGGVPWAHKDSRRAGTVHVGGTYAEIARAEAVVHRGQLLERPFVIVGQQYLADHTRSDGEVHPVYSYAHVPAGYDGDATMAIEEQIERFAPGFRDRIVARCVQSTTELSQRNPNYVGGDIVTGANSPRQLVFRPRVSLDPYYLGVPGIYLSSMETIFYGASPMSPAKLQDAIELWGPVFFQFYGQTEAPMVIAHMKKAEHDLSKPERLASCGRPTPWVHVALLDENNSPVPPGETGEICARGPLVMDGYKDMPEQTADTLAGDWLHTGDVGRYDEDGFLYIVDRTKDMVITGGFNVFPREVEDVISAHPAVAMVMVIGVPDDKWGEAVKAIVVLGPGHAPSDELTREIQQLVKDAKGSQQAPKSVDYVDDIPLTPVGKPDKKALRSVYWTDADRAVS